MLIMPAAYLGGIVAAIAIFYLGYLILHILLTRAAGRRKASAASLPPILTKNGIDGVSIAGGVLLIGLAVLLLFTIPDQWAAGIWITLTILGFAAGLVSFALWGKNSGAQPAGAQAAQAQPGEMIIVTCPNCGQKLRIPRSKRKIIVTCPKCRHSFPYRTDTLVEKIKTMFRSILEKIRAVKP